MTGWELDATLKEAHSEEGMSESKQNAKFVLTLLLLTEVGLVTTLILARLYGGRPIEEQTPDSIPLRIVVLLFVILTADVLPISAILYWALETFEEGEGGEGGDDFWFPDFSPSGTSLRLSRRRPLRSQRAPQRPKIIARPPSVRS